MDNLELEKKKSDRTYFAERGDVNVSLLYGNSVSSGPPPFDVSSLI